MISSNCCHFVFVFYREASLRFASLARFRCWLRIIFFRLNWLWRLRIIFYHILASNLRLIRDHQRRYCRLSIQSEDFKLNLDLGENKIVRLDIPYQLNLQNGTEYRDIISLSYAWFTLFSSNLRRLTKLIKYGELWHWLGKTWLFTTIFSQNEEKVN